MDKDTLQQLINEGRSQRNIADYMGRSQSSIKYWLKKHQIKTEYQTRKAYSTNEIVAECGEHGLSRWIWEKSGNRYRCSPCRVEAVSKGRRKLKAELVELLGGKCVRCGYSESSWSLHFHHIDPSTKLDDVGKFVQRRNRSKARDEAAKCELVCGNCHGEEEEARYNGLWRSGSASR